MDGNFGEPAILSTRCPRCAESGLDTSENNLRIFRKENDTHAHCFACDYHVNNYKIPENLQKDDKKKSSYKAPLLSALTYTQLKSRGISKATCEFFNYGVTRDPNTQAAIQVAQYLNPKTKQIDAQKIRTLDKKFFWRGDLSEVNYLYGQWLWTPNEKLSIVITEGEIDCLSYYEGTKGKWPVVSLRNGANAKCDDVLQQAPWLNGFKRIVFLFDGDEAGKRSADMLASSTKFKHGKVHIATLPEGKDVNELLVAGEFSTVESAVMRATPMHLDDIITPKTYSLQELLAPDSFGASIPFPALNDLIRGIKPKRLYLVTAGTGLGKSTFVQQIAYSLAVSQGLKVGCLFLEQDPKEAIKDFIALDNNLNPNRFSETPEMLANDVIEASLEKINDNLVLYRHFGSVNSDILLDRIEYMMSQLGCDVVMLDHISIVISGQRYVNERLEIDYLMTELRSLIERTGKTLVTVSHLSYKDKGSKDYSEGGTISLSNLRGSGSLGQLSDYVIALEREILETEELCVIKVLKSRRGLGKGYADRCRYDTPTGRLLPLSQHEYEMLKPQPRQTEELPEFMDNFF